MNSSKNLTLAAAAGCVLMLGLVIFLPASTSQQIHAAVAQSSSDMSQMSMTGQAGNMVMGGGSNNRSATVAIGSEVVENQPIAKISDGIKLSFNAQPIIHAYDLAAIQMQVMDANSSARLSHVDWAIVAKDPYGNLVYKTTTGHSHVGVMNFKVAFPKAGQNTISLTVSSIGSTMMGLEVEPQGRTHTMLSGSPMGFKTDPVNDFGSRTFEFPVFVQPFDQIHNVAGTMPGSSLNIELLSTATEITAGQPAPLVITVTRGNDSSMITHPDLQVTVMDSATGYILSESAPVEDMMTMHGAVHGHTGVMTLTPTFPMSGRYVIDIDLQPSPLSNYFWGHAHTQFNIFVTEPAFNAATAQTPVQNSSSNVNNTNTVDIVGLEAPFFVPNVLNIKAGTTITFVNTDGNVHTVTSVKAGTVEPDGTFDSGFLTATKTFSYTFSTPGTYNYICTIHTHMHGVINVS